VVENVQTDNSTERDRAVAAIARRLAKGFGVDFESALIDAGTAYWLVARRQRRPDSHPREIAVSAYYEALNFMHKEDGFREPSRVGGMRVPREAWASPLPTEWDVASDEPSPFDIAATADEVETILSRIRGAIKMHRGGAAFVWVVDAKREGYWSISDLMEWSGEGRPLCSRAYEVFRYEVKIFLAESSVRD